MLEEKFYTVADVARVTGLTGRTIRNYLKDGVLHGVKVGVQWRFTEDDVRHLFQETDGREDLSNLTGNRIQKFLESDWSSDSVRNEGDILESCVILDYFEPSSEKKESRKEKLRKNIESLNGDIGFSYEDKEDGRLRVVLTGDYDTITKIVKTSR